MAAEITPFGVLPDKETHPELKPTKELSNSLAGLPDLLRVEDVARLLGLTQPTIRVLLNREELPGVRIGRRWFVPKARLVELLAGEQHG